MVEACHENQKAIRSRSDHFFDTCVCFVYMCVAGADPRRAGEGSASCGVWLHQVCRPFAQPYQRLCLFFWQDVGWQGEHCSLPSLRLHTHQVSPQGEWRLHPCQLSPARCWLASSKPRKGRYVKLLQMNPSGDWDLQPQQMSCVGFDILTCFR